MVCHKMWCATNVQSNISKEHWQQNQFCANSTCTLCRYLLLCMVCTQQSPWQILLFRYAHSQSWQKWMSMNTDEDCTKATECVQTIAIDMQINTYNTFIPSHLTLASSEWLQLCWPMALLLQFSREDSVPLHTTLSKRIAPFPPLEIH